MDFALKVLNTVKILVKWKTKYVNAPLSVVCFSCMKTYSSDFRKKCIDFLGPPGIYIFLKKWHVLKYQYFFRVGRTARGEGGKGHALLILRPEELGFLRYLRQAKVPLNEFEFSWSKISDIQPQLEKLVSKNYFLNLSAKEAFKAYVRSYESHSLKQVRQIYSNFLEIVNLYLPMKKKDFVNI